MYLFKFESIKLLSAKKKKKKKNQLNCRWPVVGVPGKPLFFYPIGVFMEFLIHPKLSGRGVGSFSSIDIEISRLGVMQLCLNKNVVGMNFMIKALFLLQALQHEPH